MAETRLVAPLDLAYTPYLPEEALTLARWLRVEVPPALVASFPRRRAWVQQLCPGFDEHDSEARDELDGLLGFDPLRRAGSGAGSLGEWLDGRVELADVGADGGEWETRLGYDPIPDLDRSCGRGRWYGVDRGAAEVGLIERFFPRPARVSACRLLGRTMAWNGESPAPLQTLPELCLGRFHWYGFPASYVAYNATWLPFFDVLVVERSDDFGTQQLEPVSAGSIGDGRWMRENGMASRPHHWSSDLLSEKQLARLARAEWPQVSEE